ncbi:MAG: HIRAN domain-containing protein [Magnetococcales bacterium]|nr:HIRAN domain-containing protein [Magnetococcales bacterium]
MAHMIQHIIEPTHLFLAWQAPDGHPSGRSRKKVADLLPGKEGSITLHYLTETEDFKAAMQAGFTGYPAFPLDQNDYQSGVLEIFMRRLPPRKRRDYGDFLRRWRIDPASRISPLALLGYAGAQLPGDGFSLVHPFDNGTPPFELLEEIAGFRHQQNASQLLATLHEGQEVELHLDPNNPYDPNAIRIELPDQRVIGYINRLQAPALRQWIDHPGVRGTIDRINGTTPRPLVYVFLEIGIIPTSRACRCDRCLCASPTGDVLSR